MLSHDLEWWAERLESVQRKSQTEIFARCPNHNDAVQSLHISKSNGGVLVHCFAGCSYEEILHRVEDGIPKNGNGHTTPVSITGLQNPSEWWESYTQVPWSEWEAWGVKSKGNELFFTWSETKAVKKRKQGSKEFEWSEGGSRPIFWPSIPDRLPDEIYITEGESDCGVLRHLGFEAWAITKGASSQPDERLWSVLFSRGTRVINLCFDYDRAGNEGETVWFESIRKSAIAVRRINLSQELDPLLAEKDLRDLYLHHGKDSTHSRIRRLTDSTILVTRGEARKVFVEPFLGTAIPQLAWKVDGIILNETVGMMVGSPKMYKSWLALDLGLSVASGYDFMCNFKVQMRGPVVFISKEDPDYLLQDRIEKVAISKGLGGSYDKSLRFPKNREIPFVLDLNRDFYFDEEHVDELLKWLEIVAVKTGPISLVIFDPILRMINEVDEFKASEVGASVFQGAERIRTSTGATVLLVHHRGKNSNGKSSYGSIGFHAFAESTLFIHGDEPGKDGWVSVDGEFKSAAPTKWSYRMIDLGESYQPEVRSGK